MQPSFKCSTLSGSDDEDDGAEPKRPRMGNGLGLDMKYADSMSEMNQAAAFQLTGFKQRLSESDSDDAGRVSAAGMFGKVDVASVRDSFMKKDSAASNAGSYNPVAQKLMAKMGFKDGTGLGKHGQGRVAPIETSQQKGRRGIGHKAMGFESSSVGWDFDEELVSADETVDWIPTTSRTEEMPSLEELVSWIVEGKKKISIKDETKFCQPETLKSILESKSVFDVLENDEMQKARTKSNPYETIRGAFFLNRAAMKMANMDAVLGYMFTNPLDKNNRPMVGQNELLYFADICAGPGGFSEYVLWRKGWDAKGFGFTLKASNDFKLEDFYAASSELFEPHYGVGCLEGDGDVYKPENLLAFQKFVLENTDGQGVHFVMADGGFSVEGQENEQEILSKRLYLCQFLGALMVLRTGGHFVCKLFDLFTSFSVGLVYLMYRAFDRVSIFKPVTSRPANSERYIVCQGKRVDSLPIQSYFFELNTRMCNIWPGREFSDVDITEIVPQEIISSDGPFFQYIFDSNERLGYQQVVSLVKIQAFAKNTNLHEHRQAEMKTQCMKNWAVPEEVRTAPDKTEKPQTRLATLTKDGINDYHFEPVLLSTAVLNLTVKSLYDYRCYVAGAEQRWIVLSFGRSHIFKWDGRSSCKWTKIDDIKMELPKDTAMEVEFVTELRGEGRGQRRVMAVHVIDVMFLGGTDVRALHFNERIEKAKKFVKAITKPSRSDLAPIRVKEPVRLEQVDIIFPSLEMKLVKGSGHFQKLCYCCYSREGDQSRYIVPLGIYLVRIVKDPWMMAMSKSQNRKYYFHTNKQTAVFETPKDSVASYIDCAKSRLFWKWDGTSSTAASNGQQSAVVHSATLSQSDFAQFIRDKLAG